MKNEKPNKLLSILRSPLTLFAAMILGVIIGQFATALVPTMDFIANVYMRLLQMCVIPIVVCAVTVNIGSLITSGSRARLVKWVFLSIGSLFIFTIIATLSSAALSPVLAPDEKTQAVLATISGDTGDSDPSYIKRIDYSGDHTIEPVKSFSLTDFLYGLFPQNIFESLAKGDMLPIIFFFIMLSIMLAMLKPEHSESVYKSFQGIYSAMGRLMEYILIPFPIAIMALLAQQFSGADIFSLIGSLIPLVLTILAVTLCICVVTFIIINMTTGCSISQHLKSIRRTFFVAIGTSSPLATVGVAIEDTSKHLGIDPTLAKSVLPISISMCQPGVAVSVAVAAIYGMLIYNIPFSLNTIMLTIICSVIFSLAVIGVPGLVAVSMLTIVLNPLYIPSVLIITIYLAIVPIINPPLVFASVYANFGIVAILNKENTVTNANKENTATLAE